MEAKRSIKLDYSRDLSLTSLSPNWNPDLKQQQHVSILMCCLHGEKRKWSHLCTLRIVCLSISYFLNEQPCRYLHMYLIALSESGEDLSEITAFMKASVSEISFPPCNPSWTCAGRGLFWHGIHHILSPRLCVFLLVLHTNYDILIAFTDYNSYTKYL